MRTFCSALVALVVAGGCGGAQVQISDAPAPEAAAPARDTLARQIYAAAQDTVLAPLVAAWPREPATDRATPKFIEVPDNQARVVYRVQLLTTKDMARALAVRDAAAKDFGLDVRVDFETPYYKVRVGTFATPQEAEAVLKEARRLGYRGAWAVRMRADAVAD